MKIACVAGARPNFMKIAPMLEATKPYPKLNPILVHTGQQYDFQMSGVFFSELKIPEPDVYLGVGSASHAVQAAEIMTAFEGTMLEHKPDLVLVVGDVNSTMACALVAAKLHVPIAHVKAGIRSFDRMMPEEINRLVTDAIADYLFPPTDLARDHLLREGVSADKIFAVGNVMIDTLFKFRGRVEQTSVLTNLGLTAKSYVLMTLHRPSNVDVKENLIALLDAIEEIQEHIEIIFPSHPRTKNTLQTFGLSDRIAGMSNLKIMEPVGYYQFMNLMVNANICLDRFRGHEGGNNCSQPSLSHTAGKH